MKKLTEYYHKHFTKNKVYQTPWNSIFCNDINLDEVIQKLARNIATREDHIPEEWILRIMENQEFKDKINNIFKTWIIGSKVSEFWTKGKIMVFNKEQSGIPTVENTRPIIILPSIFKLFELSILHNFNKIIYEIKMLSSNKRGFIKNCSTEHNLKDVIEYDMKMRQQFKHQKIKAYLLFLNLRKAYNSLNRHKLFKKSNDYEVPWNIIKLLWQINNNYEVIIGGVNWIKTDAGLPQGSWLLLILFNIYIDYLLKKAG